MKRLLALVFVLFAATAQGQDAVDELKDYFRTVESLSGEFVQTTFNDLDRPIESTSGTVQIQRPDRFRWHYREPFEQLIVADGERMWVYDVDLLQVTVRPLDQVLGVGPALLLSGDFAGLEESFDISADEDGWLQLEPRQGDWDFQSVRLLMADGVPTVIEVDTGLGQLTRLELSQVQRNPRIDPETFEFTPPEGVDVVDAEGATASR